MAAMDLVIAIGILVISSCFLFSSPLVQGDRIDSCDIDSLDQCAKRLFGYGDPNYTFAATEEQVLQQCKTSKEAEVCIRQYNNRCVKPFARQYINIMLRGPSKSLKERCSSKKGIEDYLKNTDCLNATKKDLDVCTHDVIENFMLVPKTKKPEWIPLSCCYLSKLEKCSKSAIENKCPPNQTEYTSKAMRNLRGDVLDLFCDHELEWGTAKCDEFVSNLPVKEIKTKKPDSVLPVILNLMNRYITKS